MKTKTKKVAKNFTALELDGKVSFVEYKNGRRVNSFELDPELVVQTLKNVLVSGLNHLKS